MDESDGHEFSDFEDEGPELKSSGRTKISLNLPTAPLISGTVSMPAETNSEEQHQRLVKKLRRLQKVKKVFLGECSS